AQVGAPGDAGVMVDGAVRTGVDRSVLVATRVARERRGPESAARINNVCAPLGVVLGPGVVTSSVIGDRALFREPHAVEPGKAIVGADQHHGKREPVARTGLDLESELICETADSRVFGRDRTVDVDGIGDPLSTDLSGHGRTLVAVFRDRLDPGRGRISDVEWARRPPV